VKSENFTLLVDVTTTRLTSFGPTLYYGKSTASPQQIQKPYVSRQVTATEPRAGPWTSRRTLHSCSRSAPKLTRTEREQTGTPLTPRALAVPHTGLGSHGGSAAHPTRTESGDSFFSRSIDSGCGVRLERSARSPMSSNEMMGGYAGGTQVKMV
jgi:hypothetical protein